MIRLSTRHTKGLSALLLLFAVPALMAQLGSVRRDDCRDPALLFVTSLIEGSKPTGESMPPGAEQVIQWSRGTLVNPQLPKRPLRFQIVRSYDRDDTSPAAVIGETLNTEVHSLDRVMASDVEVPIHVGIDNTRQPSRFVAWVYIYEGRPVDNSFLSRLASAPQQLVRGALPTTILAVDGVLIGEQPEPVVRVAKQWLLDAWRHYETACR